MNSKLARSLSFAALLFAGLPAAAGTFSSVGFTGDADSGISLGLTYTALGDFNGSGPRVVNGVAFNDTGSSGSNYLLSGAATPFGGFANNLTGASNGLASDFIYTGDNTGNASLTLSGLIPGQKYVTTWYNAGFGNPNGRVVDIIPSDTGLPFRFDENFSGAGNGNLLRYVFTATSNSITYNFDAVNNGDSFHHYAFSNAVANPAVLVVPEVTQASGAGPGFAPFTVRNDDLLQLNLAGVTSSGDFGIDGSGGLAALTNGSFTINGGNPGNNTPLATGQNNAFVEFALDLSANTLGYDVTSIDIYGGWNDAGRDRQLYRILYSLVGDGSFIPLSALDYNPTPPGGTPSAVRAIFETALTGVDGVRIEFLNGQENGYAGYGEIDVTGTATVPEPASVGLLLLGGLTVLRRRRSM
jgi:hypothetical protein